MDNGIYGIIYMITNIKNNKKYIGITTRSNGFSGRYPHSGKGIEKVYKFFKYNKNKNNPYNEHLYRSIEKYGFDNFEVNENFYIAYSKEDLLEKERFFINFYNSNNYKFGYNHTNGGEGLDGLHFNFISKLNRRKTIAKNFNIQLTLIYDLYKDEDFNIIPYRESGWNKTELKVIKAKLTNNKTKVCKICGIEFYRSGFGSYCVCCGKPKFLDEYNEYKKYIKQIDYKIGNC